MAKDRVLWTFSEHRNEPQCFTKSGPFLKQLVVFWRLRKFIIAYIIILFDYVLSAACRVFELCDASR
jgi:hypothetical protein